MLGNIEDGQILDIDSFMADQFIARGYARAYETKVEPIRPKPAEENATFSPAAQPVPQQKKQTKQKVSG